MQYINYLGQDAYTNIAMDSFYFTRDIMKLYVFNVKDI